MKKRSVILLALVAMCVCPKLQAVEFAYDAGAEIVSSYMWRGQYNGGLSFQPDVELGFDALDGMFQFRAGAWASLGASDWKFQKGLAENENGNPNTYFVPELDLLVNFTMGGLTFGVTHYYYFGGSPFFNWGKFDPINGSAGTSQTELSLSFDLGKKVEILPLTISWSTMVGGDDLTESDKVVESADGTPMLDEDGNEVYALKRAFSSYVEVRWDQPLPFGLTLSAALGVSPWVSPVYGDLTAFPDRTLLIYGSNEILKVDAELLVEKMRETGKPIRALEYQGMFHTFPLFPIKEGFEALKEIVTTLRIKN